MINRRELLLALGALLLPPSGEPPTLWLIGDSTVRNNTTGQQGWGSALPALIDPAKLKVVNKALGGRSSRTFLTEGLWDAVAKELKKGDLVVMQFGHNDGGERFKGNRPRASIKGNGEETETGTVEATGKEEVVHSYGWYLRRYITDAKSKGATVVVCSPIPRNIWKEGKVGRASGDYGKWAKEAAQQEGVLFLDLNSLIADRYDQLGEEKVKPLFFGDHTHTSPEGAALNASVVLEGLKKLALIP
jgi:lysophospholipase L1-like esterase